MSEPTESLGALLARLRRDRGYSQEQVAQRLAALSGMHTVTRHEVSRWERGGRLPDAFWLGWLAQALNVPLDELQAARAQARGARVHARRVSMRLAKLLAGSPIDAHPPRVRGR